VRGSSSGSGGLCCARMGRMNHCCCCFALWVQGGVRGVWDVCVLRLGISRRAAPAAMLLDGALFNWPDPSIIAALGAGVCEGCVGCVCWGEGSVGMQQERKLLAAVLFSAQCQQPCCPVACQGVLGVCVGRGVGRHAAGAEVAGCGAVLGPMPAAVLLCCVPRYAGGRADR
jgi:hypothetical protein